MLPVLRLGAETAEPIPDIKDILDSSGCTASIVLDVGDRFAKTILSWTLDDSTVGIVVVLGMVVALVVGVLVVRRGGGSDELT